MDSFTSGIVIFVVLTVGRLSVASIWRSDGAQVQGYLVSTETTSWEEGRQRCGSSGDLVVIEDVAEDAFLNTNMMSMDGMSDLTEYWMGAHGADWVRARDGSSATLDGIQTFVANPPDPTHDAVILDRSCVASGVPGIWEFMSVEKDTGTTRVIICESVTGEPSGVEVEFSINIHGVERSFITIAVPNTFSIAFDFCSHYGGYLAAIESDYELNAIASHIDGIGVGEDQVWTGLHRDLEAGWRWINGDDIHDDLHDRFVGGTLPDVKGCGYFIQNLLQQNVWFNDATCKIPRASVCKITRAPDAFIGAEPDHIYLSTEVTNTWLGAQNVCKDRDNGYGDLLVIKSDEEREWLNRNMARLGISDNMEMWIGSEEIGQTAKMHETTKEKRDVDGVGCPYLIFREETLEFDIEMDIDCDTQRVGLCEVTGYVPPTDPEPTDDNDDEDDGLTTGQIVAISVGCATVVGCVAAGLGYYYYHERSSNKVEDTDANAEDSEAPQYADREAERLPYT